MKKSIRDSLFKKVTPTIEGPKNNTGTAGQAYFNAANQYRQAGAGPSVTSDARQNFNFTQQNFGNAVQQEVQGNLANAQQYAQYTEAVRNTNNQRNAAEAATSNDYMAAQAAAKSGIDQVNASTQQTIAQNNHTWRQQELQNLSNMIKQKESIQASIANAKASQSSQQRYNDWNQRATRAFRAAGDTAAKRGDKEWSSKYGNNLSAWLSSDDPMAVSLRNEQNTIRNEASLAGYNVMLNTLDKKLNWLPMQKSGGSSSAYQKRTVQETQAINAHKQNLKAVENLDKEVFKILNKLINR